MPLFGWWQCLIKTVIYDTCRPIATVTHIAREELAAKKAAAAAAADLLAAEKDAAEKAAAEKAAEEEAFLWNYRWNAMKRCIAVVSSSIGCCIFSMEDFRTLQETFAFWMQCIRFNNWKCLDSWWIIFLHGHMVWAIYISCTHVSGTRGRDRDCARSCPCPCTKSGSSDWSNMTWRLSRDRPTAKGTWRNGNHQLICDKSVTPANKMLRVLPSPFFMARPLLLAGNPLKRLSTANTSAMKSSIRRREWNTTVRYY